LPDNVHPLPAGAKVAHTLAPERRLLVVRPAPDAAGRDLTDRVRALLQSHPEIAGYDAVYDLMAFAGETSNGDVERLARAYAERMRYDGTVKYTCIASRDPNLGLWAPALDHLFADRRHYVLPSLEDAYAHLAFLRERAAPALAVRAGPPPF
jgi:hypothetical protein